MRYVLVAIVLAYACAHGGSSGQQQDSAGSGSGSGMIDAAGGIDAKQIDASNGCPVQPCTIDPQCGCTDPTKSACDLGSGSSNACRFATTTGVEGQTCTAAAGCAAGYTCVGDGTNFSCEKYCANDGECMSPRGQCVIQLTDGSGSAIAGAVMCSSNCDPATATNPLCPNGWTCDLFTATYMATTHNISDCRVDGAVPAGSSCATASCQAGLTCVTYSSTSHLCRKLCNKTNNTGCTSGTCTSFTTAFTVGGTEYGVCQ